jgi:hypothetical protein
MKCIVNSCMVCKISVESCGILATRLRNISNLLTPIIHCNLLHDIEYLNVTYINITYVLARFRTEYKTVFNKVLKLCTVYDSVQDLLPLGTYENSYNSKRNCNSIIDYSIDWCF